MALRELRELLALTEWQVLKELTGPKGKKVKRGNLETRVDMDRMALMVRG